MSEKEEKSTGNVLKVVELGLQKRVYDAMKQSGFSVEALTRKFNAEDIKITAQSIRKFIKKTKKAQQELIQKDLRAANELVSLTMDYQKALKDILKEVEEVKSMAKDEKDFATYNQMVDKLYKGIELIAKLTGDIRPKGSTDIKIIYNEINNNIEKNMKTIKDAMLKATEVVDIDAAIEDGE